MSERVKEFEALFRENYSRLYRYALDFLGDADEADDMVQELFSDLWHKHDRYHPENDAAYLFHSLRNRCINQARHKQYTDEALRQYALDRIKFIDSDIGAHEEKLQRIENAIDNLPEKTRHILEKCYMDGKKYKEVATEMNISAGMVHKHVSKALAFLRKKFRE